MAREGHKSYQQTAKPFLKWAGGKSQLLGEIDKRLPKELKEGKITKYIEPFAGSGAVLFHVLQHYPVQEAHIWDINPELISVYQVIQKDADRLIEILDQMERDFLPLDKDLRKKYYYQVRNAFNRDLTDFQFKEYGQHKIKRAAQFIFLNKTCFNGLFRVNKSGHFNVPMGEYKNPSICSRRNLTLVHQVLEKVAIHDGDYRESKSFVDGKTFVYFDPPYRPLSASSSFTSYSTFHFGDEQQMELARFFAELDQAGAKLMLSNSDPKNTNPDDVFFDRLYEKYNIERVYAKRFINSKSDGRGQITELLITNY